MLASFNFVYNNLKWHIPTCQGYGKFFGSSKKKLTKYKVIPNYSAQNWISNMANCEINFLPNHN